MKILDIIIPHKALNENTLTDLMAKGKRLLKGRNAAEIGDEITELLKATGKDIKRSPELAQAERVLADVSATVKTDRADRIIFDQMADALANRMVTKGETSLYQRNPIEELRKMYPDRATAPEWLYTSGTEFKLTNKKAYQEYFDWLTNMSEAKAKVLVEIKKAPPAPVVPKTKEEKAREKLEKDKLANDQKEQENRSTELNKQKEELKKPYPKGIPRKIMRFATDVGKSFSKYDGVFAGAELSRIIFQYWQQLNAIELWTNSQSGMPPELAKLFPPVVNGQAQTGGEKGEYKYSTEEDRYEEAAKYAVDKLWARTILQVKALGVSMFMSQGLLYVGGGTAGKASTARRILNLMRIPWTKIHIGDIAAPVLRGTSKIGQLMFVDYFISVTNPNTNEENTYTAGIVRALNNIPGVNIPPPPNFGYDPNIYNAYTSFIITDIFGGDQVLKDLTDSGLFKHTAAALGRGVMGIDAIYETLSSALKGIANWIIAVVPYLKDSVGTAPSDIPVGQPIKNTPPAVSTQTNNDLSASTDVDAMSGITSQDNTAPPVVAKPSAVANPPKTNKQRRPQADDDFLN